MKLDPADVFGSAAGGLVARATLAWLAVWLGAVGAGWTDAAQWWVVLTLPFLMLGHAVVAGAWILVTLPLLALLGYRALDFIRGEGSWPALGILSLLSLLVCLPSSGEPSFLGILILVGSAMALAASIREHEKEAG